MKLSKVFIVVVALHALLIGSIFYIGGCRTRGVQVIDQPIAPSPGVDYQVPPPPPLVTAPTTTRRPSPPRIRPEDTRPPRTTTRLPSPSAAAGEQEYAVESGDTIWAISQRFGVSMQSILDRNGITEATAGQIRVGQKIILPRGASSAPKPSPTRPATGGPSGAATPKVGTPPKPATPPPALTDGVYTVQPGDSLWTISRKYGTTIDAIREANRLTSDLLRPGQELIIPGAATTGSPPSLGPDVDVAPAARSAGTPRTETYYLEPNETLEDVAKDHGITLQELLRLNGITDPSEVKSFEPILVPLAGE